MGRVGLVLISVLFTLLFSMIQAQDSELSRTMVAWEMDNQVFVWESGDSEPRLITTLDESIEVNRVALAPDGQHIILIHFATPANDLDLSLVQQVYILSTAPDSQPIPLFELRDINPDTNVDIVNIVLDMAWANPATLYFNTIEFNIEAYGGVNNDLWRVDITTGALTQVFPPTQGGWFTPNPDGTLLAVTSAGQYQETDATITVIDTQSEDMPRTVFTFPAVASGGEFPFKPPLAWLDEHTIWVAIPDPDLIYQQEAEVRPTQLWEIDVLTGGTTNIGEVIANYFGLPTLSQDGERIIYLQGLSTSTTSPYNLYLANHDGTNSQLITSGVAGFILPSWINEEMIYYELAGEPRVQIIGGEAQPFPNEIESGLFFTGGSLANNDIVYSIRLEETFEFELRMINVADIGGESTLIADLGDGFPQFDAVVIED